MEHFEKAEDRATRIVIIEDEPRLLKRLAQFAVKLGLEPHGTLHPGEGIRMLEETGARICITDLCLQGMSGLDVIREIQHRGLPVTFLVITGYGTPHLASEADGLGAEYLEKPFNFRKLKNKLIQIISMEGNDSPSSRWPWGLVGRSASMEKLREKIAAAAPVNTSILLIGESGSGKELVARALHLSNPFHRGSLVSLNCAAIPKELVESELFGHERGAFSGAQTLRRGKLEEAHGGTLFLDEVGELNLRSQAKLLRVLEFRFFERVGGRLPITSDFRLICATNSNLSQLVDQGGFRRDLYHRIRVITMEIPPLRKRREDIRLLAQVFINEFNRLHSKSFQGLTTEAIALLEGHNWPGNVRELRNAIESAVVLGKGPMVEEEDLNLDLSTQNLPNPLPLLTLDEAEHMALKAALEHCSWVKVDAAALLGTSRSRLNRLILKHGLTEKS